MILSDIEIHTDHTFFKHIYDKNAFHLCDLFVKCLNKFKTPKTGKVVIILQEKDVDSFVRKERDKATVLMNVVEIYKDFDYSKYESEEIEGKKEILWTVIYESLITTGQQLDWELDPIIESYNKGLELRLENKWIHTNLLASRDRRYFATVSVHFDIYSIKVYVDIVNKLNEPIIHKKLIDREPNWGWYSFHSYKYSKWISSNEFCFGRRKDDRYNIKISV